MSLPPQAAVSNLKQDYKEGETTLQDAMALAIRVLVKSLDMTKLTAEKGNCHTQMNQNTTLEMPFCLRALGQAILRVLWYPHHYHSTSAPYLLIHVTATL